MAECGQLLWSLHVRGEEQRAEILLRYEMSEGFGDLPFEPGFLCCKQHPGSFQGNN